MLQQAPALLAMVSHFELHGLPAAAVPAQLGCLGLSSLQTKLQDHAGLSIWWVSKREEEMTSYTQELHNV
jgi:hypothetical protein